VALCLLIWRYWSSPTCTALFNKLVTRCLTQKSATLVTLLPDSGSPTDSMWGSTTELEPPLRQISSWTLDAVSFEANPKTNLLVDLVWLIPSYCCTLCCKAARAMCLSDTESLVHRTRNKSTLNVYEIVRKMRVNKLALKLHHALQTWATPNRNEEPRPNPRLQTLAVYFRCLGPVSVRTESQDAANSKTTFYSRGNPLVPPCRLRSEDLAGKDTWWAASPVINCEYRFHSGILATQPAPP
jgi:hypothetical protein